jgi:hypothetical protein
METLKLKTETVYSPVEDKEIKKTLGNSPMWKKSVHPDDLAEEQKPGVPMYEYTFKFAGTKVVQHMSTKKIVN